MSIKNKKEIKLTIAEKRKRIQKTIKSITSKHGQKKLMHKVFRKKVNIMIELVVGVSVGAFCGYQLDVYLNSLPIFLFLCTICGTMGAVWNIYKAVLRDEKSSRSVFDKKNI